VPGSVRVVSFDLDDTLAVSKQRVDPRMAALLARLLDRVDVCIISGGRFEQFDSQVLRHLPLADHTRPRLHLMPTCGTRYYRAGEQGWAMVYAEDLGEPQKRRVVDVLTAGAKELGLWQEATWGEIIEDRGSQITFSALGQAAPPEAKYAWDPDGTKKRKLREYAAARLPDLEVRSGGSTSIDVTRKGIDKAYGMRRLMEQLDLGVADILFIGDRLDEGGNDYPVRELGIPCVAVQRWQDTAEYLDGLLGRPAWPSAAELAAERAADSGRHRAP
jgi:hypothetical protein